MNKTINTLLSAILCMLLLAACGAYPLAAPTPTGELSALELAREKYAEAKSDKALAELCALLMGADEQELVIEYVPLLLQKSDFYELLDKELLAEREKAIAAQGEYSPYTDWAAGNENSRDDVFSYLVTQLWFACLEKNDADAFQRSFDEFYAETQTETRSMYMTSYILCFMNRQSGVSEESTRLFLNAFKGNELAYPSPSAENTDRLCAWYVQKLNIAYFYGKLGETALAEEYGAEADKGFSEFFQRLNELENGE